MSMRAYLSCKAWVIIAIFAIFPPFFLFDKDGFVLCLRYLVLLTLGIYLCLDGGRWKMDFCG